MKTEETILEGILVITPEVFSDERGFFYESYNADTYNRVGIRDVFVQDNHSKSVRNTVRGLHFQSEPGQAKLLRVVKGAIFDVAVDIRIGSKTFGRWVGIELSAENRKQVYIPVGFAHGFCVVSDEAEVLYKCSSLYNPATERTIAWNDPDIGIDWPVKNPILSQRDRTGKSLAEYKRGKLEP